MRIEIMIDKEQKISQSTPGRSGVRALPQPATHLSQDRYPHP